MKNLIRGVVVFVFFLGFLFTTNQSAEAVTTYHPAGCTATTAYSPLSGQKCYTGSVLGDSITSNVTLTVSATPSVVTNMTGTTVLKWDVENAPSGATIMIGISGDALNSGDTTLQYRNIASPHLLDGSTGTVALSNPNITSFPSHGTINFTPNYFNGYIPISGPLNVTVMDSNGNILARESAPLQIVANNQSNCPPVSNVRVISPNGFETFQAGQQVTVKWATCNIPNTDYVNIDLVSVPFPPTGINSINLKNTLNDGEEVVTLPYNATFGTSPWAFGANYKMGVTRFTNPGPSAPMDLSDRTFAINPGGSCPLPKVTVISPNGHETFTAGQQVTVKWSTCDIPSPDIVSIDLVKVPFPPTGINSINLAHTANEGELTVTLPATSEFTANQWAFGKSYKIGVTRVTNPGPSAPMDLSDNAFTVNASAIPPSVTVISPNGGETYNLTDTLRPNWTENNIPISIRGDGAKVYIVDLANPGVEYYLGQGERGFGTTISHTPSISQAPSLGRKNFKLKVVYPTLNVFDWSDDTFTIKSGTSCPLPKVTVVYPNGHETFTAGQQVTVKWSTCDIPSTDTVSIDLVRVPFPTTGINSINLKNTLNDGEETVILPATAEFNNRQWAFGKSYKIGVTRVTNAGASAPMDLSDNAFTINGTASTSCNTSTSPSITLLSPLGGAYRNGDSITIRWTSCNIPANAPIQILFNGATGGPNGAFAIGNTATPNDGAETFLLPPPPMNSPLPAGMYYIFMCQDNGGPGECVNGTSTAGAPGSFNIVSSRATSSATLRIGSRGEAVKEIQRLLNIKADGIYGKGTAARVKAWQLSNALKPDGIFGPASWAKIK